MPFVIRTTFAFLGQGQGWSESFYWSSADGNLQTAENLTTPLAQKRAKLLANTYVLQVIRNSVVIDDGGAKVLRQSDLAEPGFTGVASWTPATPNLCLLCVWQTANNRASKKQYMRGIPNAIDDGGKIANFNAAGAAAFGSNFQSWASAMQAFGAGWLAGVVSKTAIINTYTVDADTAQVTFTLAAPGVVPWPVSFGASTRVYVSLPGKNPLDGALVVVPTSALSCFTTKGHPAPPLPVDQIGVMKLRTPNLVTLAPLAPNTPTGVISPQRVISRKTGRPTYASRGRQSARVLW